MWMLEWIINHIPWYIPVVVVIVALLLCWQWIAPLWVVLPNWAKITIGFIAAIFIAAQYGRNRGVASEQARRKSLNEHAITQRNSIDEKIRNMPPNAVTRHLERNGWLRD